MCSIMQAPDINLMQKRTKIAKICGITGCDDSWTKTAVGEECLIAVVGRIGSGRQGQTQEVVVFPSLTAFSLAHVSATSSSQLSVQLNNPCPTAWKPHPNHEWQLLASIHPCPLHQQRQVSQTFVVLVRAYEIRFCHFCFCQNTSQEPQRGK